MPALLEVAGLRAYYGARPVLHGLSFAVPEGGVATLLGANGAGKTTTLRALCRMLRVEGEIRFAGQRIDARSTEDVVRLGIAHVPDGRGTFVDLTVEENLRVGAITRRDRAGAGVLVGVLGYFPGMSRASRSAGASRPAPCRAASSRCSRSRAP
jgi:branched-chain amino acid transport system ATP-binding protein